MENIKHLLTKLIKMLEERKRTVLALSCLVVFVTTYMLILPAFTLEKDEAVRQGGIDIGTQASADLSDESADIDADGSDAEAADANDEADSAEVDTVTDAGVTEDTPGSSDADSDESGKAAAKSEADAPETAAATDNEEAETIVSGDDLNSSLTFEGEGFSVAVEDTAGVLPSDTSVEAAELVEEPTEGTKAERKAAAEEYRNYYEKALEAINDEVKGNTEKKISFVKFYDITLQSGEDAIQPEKPVNVTISYDKRQQKDLKVEEKKDVRIIHFAEDEKNSEITAELLDKKAVDVTLKSSKMTEASFEAERFSVYAVVYTVDLTTYVVSGSGDTYEVNVTYDETAGIPADAELRVREISKTEKEYETNVKATNKQLKAQNEPEINDPVQFDISIISNGKEVEPKEGSTVNVEIKLAPEAFGIDKSANEKEPGGKSADENTEKDHGEIWFNGEKLTTDTVEGAYNYTVAHITNDGKAEIIDEVKNSIDEDDNVIIKFDTESFSDYLVDTGTTDTLSHLPNTIYVGDVIYLYDHANYTVNTNGGVVSDISIANNNTYREILPQRQGWFTITSPAWDEFVWGRWVHHDAETKAIQVLPARTGKTAPELSLADGIVNNADIGITLNLFDYDTDESLNDYYNQFNHSTWPYLNSYTSDGINAGHPFKFWGSGVGRWNGEANALNNQQINWNYNHYNDGITTGIVKNQLSGGYPQLSGGGDLRYLFEPSNGTDKVAYLGADRLFRKESPDSDYYVYNSNTNYAWYNPQTNQFEVYSSTYEQKSDGEQTQSTNGKAIGFFPFHKWDDEYDLYVNWNKNLKHHFGMSMSVDFSLPKDPKAVLDKNGNDIVFEFSGDDDMWVFIDGKLAMDIGGIHQPVNGKINFTQKTVTTQATKGDTSVHTQNYDFPDSLYDGRPHKLEVFYIERGGCDSNCMIKFNLTQYTDVEFDKVDTKNVDDKLKGAVFGLYLDEECTKPLMERLKTNTPGQYTNRAYIAESDENGHIKFEGIGLGTYYLKELVPPDGYEKDDTIRTVNVFLIGQSPFTVTYSIDGPDADANTNGLQIGNKMPEPIDLSLEKKWQNEDGTEIDAPQNASAVFELHRIRTYEIIEEEEIQQESPKTAKLIVGWINNDTEHVYKEYTLLSGSRATVSWQYKDGYTGEKACYVDDTRIDKNPANQVFSQATGVLSDNQVMRLFIVDSSADGDAISSINVAGEEYVGGETGGIVHKFETVTEPDTEFTYTGDSNVIDNRVTLNDANNWSYEFPDLPVVGKGKIIRDNKEIDVVFNYSYYLSEVSSENSAGATVIYVDGNGNVIGSASEAETNTTGSQTVINKVPFGYLQIEKKVTYNSSDQNLTDAQKSKMAGEYKFKIYTKEACGAGDAVQDPNAAADATDKDMIITITIDEDGQAVSSDAIKLLAGNYWIKEIESSNPMMLPVNNPIAVTVTKDNTTSSPAISTLTNNYDENNGPDKIVIDIEKKFQGLDAVSQVPANFQLVLEYKVGNQTKTITLENHMATGINGESINWTQSEHGFTWHWKVGNIDPEAKDFRIKESNYDEAKGYDWTGATLNGTDIKSSAGEYNDLTVTAPTVTFGDDVKTQRITSDSQYNKAFFLLDDDVLLTARTANLGSLVISKKPLNLMQRKAVEANWPGQGSIKLPATYFSIEEHPDGFTYDRKEIKFGEKDGKTVVLFTSNASSQEAIFEASYTSQEALNIANLVNVYEEVPVTIEIIKTDNSNAKKKLSGAIFTLRQLDDKAPNEGRIPTKPDTTSRDSDATDDEGKTSFGNLTHGYYEIKEKSAPEGYIMSEDTVFYFKIESGVVTWLEKGEGKPSTWDEASSASMIAFEAAKAADTEAGTPATNATFTVENEPGASLPNSGGIGTTIFYVFGTILVLSCGIYLIARRRMKDPIA